MNENEYVLDRVVSFRVDNGQVIASELCDEYFWAELDGAQVDDLIAWLTKAREALS
jgi:hypothetical protein